VALGSCLNRGEQQATMPHLRDPRRHADAATTFVRSNSGTGAGRGRCVLSGLTPRCNHVPQVFHRLIPDRVFCESEGMRVGSFTFDKSKIQDPISSSVPRFNRSYRSNSFRSIVCLPCGGIPRRPGGGGRRSPTSAACGWGSPDPAGPCRSR
jgi:hypothetical protein